MNYDTKRVKEHLKSHKQEETMKRKKSTLMAAQMMATVSLISCASQTNYVIEGELKGLEEGTEIQLFQNEQRPSVF